MENLNLFAEDFFETEEDDDQSQEEFDESYNNIIYEFADRLVDTDHVIVYENGTIAPYGGNNDAIFEAKIYDSDAKKKAVKQIQTAMRRVFKESGSSLKVDYSFSMTGKNAFIKGSSDTLAMPFTKKGRRLVTLALASIKGARVGLASIVHPWTLSAAATKEGIKLGREELSKNEKDLAIFLKSNIQKCTKECNDTLTDFTVSLKQVKGSPVILFTFKPKREK
jgi:hypothetical protein